MNSYDQEQLIEHLRDIAESLGVINARIGWFQRFFQALHPNVVVPPVYEAEASDES